MTPETVLSLCSYVALAGWALLVFLPKWETGTRVVVPVVAVGVLSAVYAALAITMLPGADGGFGSLADIATLFSDPWILLAG